MLVVTRKDGESLMIGRDVESIAAGEYIEVKICDIEGSRAKIGIDATGDVQIFRAELFERRCEEEGLVPHFEPCLPIFAGA